MLEFFRKYQRFFMLLVSVFVIVSFTFFGTYGAINANDSEKELVVAKAIDGSKLTYAEINRLGRLLAREERLVERQFLDSGVAGLLIAAYQEPLRPTVQSWIDKARKARFYVHPVAKELGARVLWDRFCPGLMDAISRIQTMDPDHLEEVVAAWVEIYQLQKKCPPDLVKRILLYQQQQYGLPVDSRLAQEDFALFGNHSLADWFGRDVLDLFSQVMLNGAVIARQHGVRVSKEEAAAELTNVFSPLDATLRSIGLQKGEAVELWQKALSYACDMKTVSHALLVDDLAEKRFAEYAGEKADLKIYRLPSELRFKEDRDGIAFDAYVSIACEPSPSIPSKFKDLEAVEQAAPELVAESLSLTAVEVDLPSLGNRISLKELWAWQVQDASWPAIRAAFPELKNEPRFEQLEELDPAKRANIDAWCREAMVAQRPEWIEQELSLKSARKIDIDLYSDGTFEGYNCKDPIGFVELISQVELLNEPLLYREASKVVRIVSVDRIHEKRILPFAEAKSAGRIPIDRYLEGQYLQVRAVHANLFLDKQGEWLSYKKAHGKLVELLYPEGSLTKRFVPVMQQILDQGGQGSLGLFDLVVEEMSVSRTKNEEWMAELPFTQGIGLFSPLQVLQDGDIAFFTVLNRSLEPAPCFEHVLTAQDTLAKDAQRQLAAKLLEALLNKEAIVLPVRNEGEKHDDF